MTSATESNLPGKDLEKIAFEQSRLEHCMRLFNEENKRRESFEKTAQFYLTFVTAFIGALFLKIDFLITISDLLAVPNVPVTTVWIVYSAMGFMLFSLLLALICILECIRVRRYKSEFPTNPTLRLFAPNSPYAGGENKSAFLKITAMTYIATIEANFDITEQKGLWIERAALFILLSVLSLFVLLSMTVYLMIS